MKDLIKRILPASLISSLLPLYHQALSFGAAVYTRFPAKKLYVIEIGGTKGKSTTSEMVFACLAHAGKKTALVGTIRFAIGEKSEKNLKKMTMPGRGFIQFFLRRAITAGATHAVIEVTTEGERQARTNYLYPNILVMTNVQKEHIESHGSFEKYVERKWDIVHKLEQSSKGDRTIIACTDDEWNAKFVNAKVPTQTPYSIAELSNIKSEDNATSFEYKNVTFTLPLPGIHNASNALACIKVCEHIGISLKEVARALASMPPVRGRSEHVDAGQDFLAVVDYAHTPDSLKALYTSYTKPNSSRKLICVLGNTGGGRDTWKRGEMAAIAETYCSEVILTNEDPYDEDPEKIIEEMVRGMKRPPLVILNRRDAIHVALSHAKDGDAVLISGKGTDPWIMGPGGSKIPWDDATVVREELAKVLPRARDTMRAW